MKNVLLTLLFLCISSSFGLLLETPNGFLEGAETKYHDHVIHTFKHVPFAAPPIGNLRFRYPQKVQTWKGVRNATAYGPACLSNTSMTSSPQKWMDEDCLHNNIFTSEKCIKFGGCPVVFYLHGGALLYDSAVMYNDDKIIENFVSRDIVFIITAKRLGIFGLLTFEDDEIVPTNLPFYDIKTSLEWVQDSISIFGGDPYDVTLFGHSAGCSEAIIMTYSRTFDPNLKLFHKVICMSPLPGIQDTTERLTMSWKFAEMAGCATGKQNPSKYMIRNVVECLQNKTASELLRIQRQIDDVSILLVPKLSIHVGPLLHGDTWTDFLDQPNNTDRKILLGVNLKEYTFSPKPSESIGTPTFLDCLGYRNPLITAKKFNADMRNRVLENGDRGIEAQASFLYVIQMLNSYTKAGGEAYLYQFRFPKQALHGQDLSYIMGTHLFEMDENERALSTLYPKMFTDFVISGKPGDGTRYNPFYRNYYNMNFNTSDGTRPHNSLEFENKIIEYFTKDLTEYDMEISKQRLQTTEIHPLIKGLMPTFSNLPSLKSSLQRLEFISYMKSALITVLFTLTGISFGWCLRGRNRKYYDDGEKVPLLS